MNDTPSTPTPPEPAKTPRTDENILSTGKTVTISTERIVTNAAALRLFRGEYRNSGDRHNDALIVRERLEQLEEDLTVSAAKVKELEADIALFRQQRDDSEKGLLDIATKYADLHDANAALRTRIAELEQGDLI